MLHQTVTKTQPTKINKNKYSTSTLKTFIVYFFDTLKTKAHKIPKTSDAVLKTQIFANNKPN